MGEPHDHDEFCRGLADVQRTLYAYILRLLPNAADANDVLQETNLVLIRKQDEFRSGSDFLAWAVGIARYQVLAFRRDEGRDRLVFGDRLFDQLANRGAVKSGTLDVMFEALNLCREKLSEADRTMLESRYGDDLSVTNIAKTLGRSPRAISQALYRIRVTLLECVQQALGRKGDGDNAHK
jgi:RNA polymerase sigma-70 factor, ECF subfamily